MTSRLHQKLFSPFRIGPLTLAHRVVMAPLTRMRSHQTDDVPGEMMVEYHPQRASEGGFITANPDLPKRIRLGLPLNVADRATFYGGDRHGYTDYPFYQAA